MLHLFAIAVVVAFVVSTVWWGRYCGFYKALDELSRARVLPADPELRQKELLSWNRESNVKELT